MAKVLIDIPDDAESKYIYNSIINKHHIVNDVEIYEQRGLLVRAVRNGIILNGLTNGEVIQKMFPDCTIFPTGNFVLIIDKNDKTIGSFDLDWWNRKWGE